MLVSKQAFNFCKFTNFVRRRKQLNSWRFSRYSVPIHCLVHGHITYLTMKLFAVKCDERATLSHGNQFTIARELLAAVARDQGRSCRWPDVVAGISARFSIGLTHLFCYPLMTCLFGKSEFCFPRISMIPWSSIQI